MNENHLALFDPYVGGHHGLFIQHLVRYWGHHRIPGTLELMVTAEFIKRHQQVTHLIHTFPESEIIVTHIDPLPALSGSTTRALIQHDLLQGKLLQSALTTSQASHVLLMYFDHLQISLATGLRRSPSVHMAGIYFRPSFHYPIHTRTSYSFRHVIKQHRKKLQLRLALRNPVFKTLFSLDPYVVPDIQKMNKHTRVVTLPDGVEHPLPSSAMLPAPWTIEPGRVLALCFGSLARRKGTFKLLEAVRHLQPKIQSRLALIFAGSVVASERDAFYKEVALVRDHTQVQIVLDDRYVKDEEVHPMIKCADLVLVPYQHHIGSSNVLIRAANATIPVLGSNYGLMGAQIIEHKLGTALDSTNPEAIAKGIVTYLASETPPGFDKTIAKKFGASNSADAYAETIFSSLEFV